MKIGLMRLSALGDIVWMIPLLRTLVAHYKNAQICVFVDPIFSSILENIEGVKVYQLKKPRSFSDYKRAVGILKKFEFDIFLCTQANLRVNVLYPFIKAKRKIGFDNKRGRDGHSFFVDEQIPFIKEHSLEAFLGFARYLNIEKIKMDLSPDFSQEDILWAKKFIKEDQKNIVIHPKASSIKRCWSLSKYASLIDSLYEKYQANIILTGAPSDIEFSESIKALLNDTPVVDLSGKSTLQNLMGLYSQADLVIAPDSGPIHVANAVGAKVIGIYAAVPASYTGPYGQEKNCVDVYDQACKKFLGKSKDEVPWRTRVKGEGPMDLVSLESVLQRVPQFLGK